MKRTLTLIFSTGLIAVLAFAAFGQTNEFNYQGNLASSGSPANGNYDLEFVLYDSLNGGTQVGPTLARTLVVTNGNFAVKLDFGPVYPGADRYLEIHVRPSGQGSYTVLSPRQLINATPYAVKAVNADTAANSLQLGGMAANQYVVTTDPRMTDARPPTSGNGNYIQNGTAVQASSNFNISGDGSAAGTISGNIVRASTQFNIGSNRILTANVANTSVGLSAGLISPGLRNSFFGGASGANNPAGNDNSYFGFASGGSAGTGSQNSFFGSTAGQNTSTSNNSYFGFAAGLLNTSGSSNTAIGASANFGFSNLVNAAAIGANARSDASNALVLGSINGINGATANTNVGIGTTAPGVALDVQNSSASVALRLRSAAGSSSIYLDRASAIAANSAQIAFNSAGTADFAMGTSQGSAGNSDFSIYNYGTASNAFTIQQSTGNIGIGTPSPGTSLHLRSASTTGFAIQMENTSTAKRLYIGNYGTVGAGNHWPGRDSANTSFLYSENSLVFNTPGGIYFSGSTTAEHMRIQSNGLVVVDNSLSVGGDVSANRVVLNNPTGFPGATALCVTPTGPPYVIVLCASSLRFKTNLGTFKSGLELINRLRPITFNWKDGGMKDFGLAAEDVAKAEPLLATYDSKGVVQGVKYDRIGVVLINAVKEQQAEIEEQQKTIRAQQAEIEQLKKKVAEIDALKALVCSGNLTAAMCK